MWYSELETMWISLIWWPLRTSIRQAKLCSDNSIFESNYCFFFFIRSSTRIFYLFCFGFLSLPSSLFCSPELLCLIFFSYCHIYSKEKKLHFVLFWRLFWPAIRKNCSSHRENLRCKFEAEGRDFSKFLRSLE